MNTKESVKIVLNKYEQVRFGEFQPNIDNILTDLSFLDRHISIWEECLKEFKSITSTLIPDVMFSVETHPEVRRLLEYYDRLMDVLFELKKTVVPQPIFQITNNIQRGIEKTLYDLLPILHIIESGKLDAGNLEDQIKIAVSQFQVHQITLSQTQRFVRSSKSKAVSPSFDKQIGVKSQAIRVLLDNRTQIRLWILTLISLLVFSFTDTPFETLLRSLENWTKLFVLLSILWFPLIFIVSHKKSTSNIAIYTIVWAVLGSIFAYGWLEGLAISLILFVIPLSRILKKDDLSNPTKLEKHLINPVTFALALVGLIITQEFVWSIGLGIWLTFYVFLRGSSYKFFRQNYDLMEDLFPESSNREQRANFFAIALITSSLVVTTGLVGQIQQEFAVEIYSSSAGFALTLVTILLAVQAIIPGINVWSKEKAIKQRNREMRLMIRANKGLGGFMTSFYFLLVVSVVGWILSNRLAPYTSIIVDLSHETNFSQISNIINIVNPFAPPFYFSPQITLLSFSTFLFIVCISLAIYSMLQLYYLFSTAGVFLLPLKDALYSLPVHIGNVRVLSSESEEEQDKITSIIKKLLKSQRKLNGQIINKVTVISEPENDKLLRIAIEFDMDYVELDEILNLSKEVFRLIFESTQTKKPPVLIDQVTVSVFRENHSMGRHNVFALHVNRDQWLFLKKDIPGFTLEYKVKQVLKAKIVEYVRPDAQVF